MIKREKERRKEEKAGAGGRGGGKGIKSRVKRGEKREEVELQVSKIQGRSFPRYCPVDKEGTDFKKKKRKRIVGRVSRAAAGFFPRIFRDSSRRADASSRGDARFLSRIPSFSLVPRPAGSTPSDQAADRSSIDLSPRGSLLHHFYFRSRLAWFEHRSIPPLLQTQPRLYQPELFTKNVEDTEEISVFKISRLFFENGIETRFHIWSFDSKRRNSFRLVMRESRKGGRERERSLRGDSGLQ